MKIRVWKFLPIDCFLEHLSSVLSEKGYFKVERKFIFVAPEVPVSSYGELHSRLSSFLTGQTYPRNYWNTNWVIVCGRNKILPTWKLSKSLLKLQCEQLKSTTSWSSHLRKSVSSSSNSSVGPTLSTLLILKTQDFTENHWTCAIKISQRSKSAFH